MSEKFLKGSRKVTHLTLEFCAKLSSADYLENSLSAGSKRRLRKYREGLIVSRGVNQPLFDSKMKKLILQYAYDPIVVKKQIEYLDTLRDEEGYKFSRDLRLYHKIEKALTSFKAPDHPSFRWNKNYQAALKSLIDEFSSAKLSPLVFNGDDDIKEALPKETTHSGFYWILSGKKRKGDNLVGLYDAFVKEKDKALTQGSFKKPILIGFRTQASGEYEDNGTITNTCKHKTRMVSMYDLVSITNELQFSIPFQNFIARKRFYAGGKDAREISVILNDWRTKYRKYFSIDYSNFDATISSWLIEDAFEIVRASFKPLGEENFLLFSIMKRDFIDKEFILNEGILRVKRGVPSGSMWTQIIDSLVNALVIRTYFMAMDQKADMIAMGDDNCIFTNYETSIEMIASYIRKNFGLEVKVDDKSAMGSTSTREGIKFLSRYWRWDGQYRHPNQLISRMLFPERFRNYNESVTPELVLYAFILTYGLGMSELINCAKFMADNPQLRKETLYNVVDSRYLPGSMAFIRDYTRSRDIGFHIAS